MSVAARKNIIIIIIIIAAALVSDASVIGWRSFVRAG